MMKGEILAKLDLMPRFAVFIKAVATVAKGCGFSCLRASGCNRRVLEILLAMTGFLSCEAQSATVPPSVIIIMPPPPPPPPLVISGYPVNQAAPAGANVTFTVSAYDPPPFAFQWAKGGVLIHGATNASLSILGVTTNDVGVYTVNVSNGSGSQAASASLALYASPSFTTQPESQAAFPGNTISFSAAAGGIPIVSFQWRKEGVPLAGRTGTTLTLSSIGAGDLGAYDVVASNLAGSITSMVATLSFVVPPNIVLAPQSRVALVGETVSFKAVATGTPPLTYSWVRSRATIQSGTNDTLTFTNLSEANGGGYQLIVGNRGGTAYRSFSLNVYRLPAVVSHPVGQTILFGQSTSLSVAASSEYPFTIQWLKEGIPLSGATNSTLMIAPATPPLAGNYSAKVSNVGGSVVSSNAAVRVLTPQHLRQPIRDENGSIRVAFENVYGWPRSTDELAVFEVWTTTNLANQAVWVRLTNGITIRDGQWEVIDSNGTNLTRRFYRVIAR